MDNMMFFYILGAVVMLIIIIASIFSKGNLNNIKSKTVGDGQHGEARWSTPKEKQKAFINEKFTPDKWRNGENLPTEPGLILDFFGSEKKPRVLIDTDGCHTLLISITGGGKTTYFLYNNLEYACATGVSFLTTDTKGDIFRNYAGISKKHYGYTPFVLDFRQPTKSNCYNLLHLVNKYMSLYLNSDKLVYLARAERYSKIIAKTIVRAEGFVNGGSNAFFYDAAEGVISAVILLISELCPPPQRHIVSVFKIVRELMDVDPDTVPRTESERKHKKPRKYFQQLMDILPDDHKAKWLASSALTSPDQALSSVISTAMSNMLRFIDSELEQIICFDSEIDAERFCKTKTSVFVVFPEDDSTKHFMVSLFVRQMYDECIKVAEQTNNVLDKRVYFFLDEFGTISAIHDVEGMFTAGRSRRIFQVPMIQSISQLNDKYGNNKSDTIQENCTNTLFSQLSARSKTAQALTKALGSETVMSGSISQGQNRSNTNLNMIGKPLMTTDQLEVLPKGDWILDKIGMHPMKMNIRQSFKTGIELDSPYEIPEQGLRTVSYASREELFTAAKQKYPGSNTSWNNLYSEEAPVFEMKKEKKTLSQDYLSE